MARWRSPPYHALVSGTRLCSDAESVRLAAGWHAFLWGNAVVLLVLECECPLLPTGPPELRNKKRCQLTDKLRIEWAGKARGWCDKLRTTRITEEMAAQPGWAKLLAGWEDEFDKAAAFKLQLRADVAAGAHIHASSHAGLPSSRLLAAHAVHLSLALLCAVQLRANVQHVLTQPRHTWLNRLERMSQR